MLRNADVTETMLSVIAAKHTVIYEVYVIFSIKYRYVFFQ